MVIDARPAWAPDPVRNGGPLRMVTLSTDADKSALPLVRTSVAQVGAVLHLPPDRLADLRLAVNEACVCLLAAAPWEADPFGSAAPEEMEVSFDLYPAELHVTVCAAAAECWPEPDGLGWAVLRRLPGEVRVSQGEGLGVLTVVEPLPMAG